MGQCLRRNPVNRLVVDLVRQILCLSLFLELQLESKMPHQTNIVGSMWR